MLVRFFLPSTSIPTKVWIAHDPWLALRLPMCLIIQPEPSAIEIRQACPFPSLQIQRNAGIQIGFRCARSMMVAAFCSMSCGQRHVIQGAIV